MISLATASQKGGVGKTTVCINLGHALAKRGWKTLLVDTDPQGGIGLSLSKSTRKKRGFYDFLSHGGDAKAYILTTRLPDFSILPSGSTHDLSIMGNEKAIREKVRDLLNQLRDLGYDCVMLDTAAGLSSVTEVIVREADWVLIPQQAEPLAVRSIPLLLETLSRFRSEGARVRIAGILLTMLQSDHKASLQVAEELRQMLPASMLFTQAIPRDPLFMDASVHGLPLALIKRNPPPTALLFEQIAIELEERLGLHTHQENSQAHASLLD